MLRNQFIIAFRNLIRNPVYSIINVAGLAFGMAASILILLWVQHEVTYDRFHKNSASLYKVLLNVNNNNRRETWNGIPSFAFDELKAQGGVKHVAIGAEPASQLLSVGDKALNFNGRFVSAEFLDMFRFDLISGVRESILADPTAIVLTESTAKALFGDVDPINKIVSLDNHFELKVTGVLREIPKNSSFQFDFLASFELYKKVDSWVTDCIIDPDCGWFQMFVELEENADVATVGVNVRDLIIKKTTWLEKQIMLYPMERWNLHHEFENGVEAEDDYEDFVMAFAMAAFGILLVACINFMNLSTARSERRAREIGIRKISGSLRKDLIYQFLRESTLISAIAFVLAMVVVELLLPVYNMVLEKNLTIDFSSPGVWLASIGLILLTGLTAGSYPAFFLSSFQPAHVLKGGLLADRRSISPRKVLIIVQFGFSILLIVQTIAVYQQLDYAKNRSLGYDKSNLITIPSNEGLATTYRNIKHELLISGVITSACKTNSPITDVYESNFMNLPGSTGPDIDIENIYAEYDYAKTMGIKIDGRDFSEEVKSDTAAVLLNQVAVDRLGLKKPVGSTVIIAGSPHLLIGVLENVLMDSPYGKIKPLYVVLETEWLVQATSQNITMRMAPTTDIQAAIKKIESVVKKHNPKYPFQYSFVEDDFDRKFHQMRIRGWLTNVFALVAILIASLGLFGLVSFMAERRTKEFGVRKVLGASWMDLIALISREFIRIITIAFVIASPIAWWQVSNFLESYPYHITFNWVLLPLTGVAVLLISLGVVVMQASRIASANPVDSLRTE